MNNEIIFRAEALRYIDARVNSDKVYVLVKVGERKSIKHFAFYGRYKATGTMSLVALALSWTEYQTRLQEKLNKGYQLILSSSVVDDILDRGQIYEQLQINRPGVTIPAPDPDAAEKQALRSAIDQWTSSGKPDPAWNW